MKLAVKKLSASYCEEEGDYNGYVVNVVGRTHVRTNAWVMTVRVSERGDYGKAPTDGIDLKTDHLSPSSPDEVFELGSRLGSEKIDQLRVS